MFRHGPPSIDFDQQLADLRARQARAAAPRVLTPSAQEARWQRYVALSAICARRKRAWLIQPEENVRAFRAGLGRAYRLALRDRVIWAAGDRRCDCHKGGAA